MQRDAFVIGVGHTAFGENWDRSYRHLLTEAGSAALEDAKVQGEDIDEVFVGSMSTGKLLGQEHIAPLLLDGAGLAHLHLPATRVEAAGASGAVAFRQGVQAIRSGIADIVVVGGIEKMTDVSDTDQAAIQSSALDQEWEHVFGATDAGLHALIAKQHMARFGTTREQMAGVAVKNHLHAVHSNVAQFRKEIRLDMVLGSSFVAEPLTVFDCAPSADGAACVVLCGQDIVDQHDGTAVRVAGSRQASDTLALHSRADITSMRATEHAARHAYKEAGISIADIDVAEVHDAFTISEIIAIEDLGLVKKGEGGPATTEGRTTHGGDVVVNPSGGLKARGHPAGATGIAQICELTWQLRGDAGRRQVDDARIGVAQNMGGTGATVVVTVLEALQ